MRRIGHEKIEMLSEYYIFNAADKEKMGGVRGDATCLDIGIHPAILMK